MAAAGSNVEAAAAVAVAPEAAAGSADWLREMFEQAPSAVALLLGPDHVFAFANPVYRAIVGDRPLIGLPLAVALPEVVGQGYHALVEQVRESGEAYRGSASPVELVRADGTTEVRLLDFVFQPMRDPSGATIGVLVQSTDTTERAQSEAALRHAKEERDFVLALVERQRLLSEPNDVMQAAAEAAARYLGVARAGFFRVTDAQQIEFGMCWTDGRLPVLDMHAPAAMFGSELLAAHRAGETLAYSDLQIDSKRTKAAIRLSGARSGISVPLLRRGRWQGGFYVSDVAPRCWTPGEIGLAEELAQLSWDAVARAEAVAAIRQLNASLAEEVAKRTAERDRIWEVSHDLLGVNDPGVGWLAVNPAWTRVLGWESREIIGRTTAWLVHPEDRDRARAMMTDLRQGATSANIETRLRARDGTYRTLAWTITAVDGLLYTTARDVTDERRQQEALHRAEERVRLVADAIDGLGTWSYDIAREVYMIDATLAPLFGLAPGHRLDAIPKAEMFRYMHPTDRARAEAQIAESHTREGAFELEYRILLPGGAQHHLLVRRHTLAGPDGVPNRAIGVVIDVTRTRELEERLRQSQKMEAVGQLTGGLAHDFNNLLTGVSGALEMLQLRLSQGRGDEAQRYIRTAQGAVTRAAGLTHRLLAFSRRQTLDPRPTNVLQLVAGLEELIRRTVGPEVEVMVDAPADLWPALVDAGQLESALINLCINARDAMPGGGRITIRGENLALDSESAQALDLPGGDYLVLSVSDTGTGMTEEVKSRAFDPFFTTKPLGEGTGLGLSMIYGFAKQSGGHVRILSEVGEGTTIRIKLPRYRGAVAADETASEAEPIAQRRDGTVLVVDDEPTVRALVVDLLGELGYTPLAAGDGSGALRILESHAVIDLLITDVGLPGGMNGREVADAARQLRPGLPTIFITGFAENTVFGERPLEPGMRLVTKPFTIQHLAGRIREVLG